MPKTSYSISVAGVVGGIMLPRDIFGVATMIADKWPIIEAFLPWIGTVLVVGFGTWLTLSLVIDVPRYCRRRVARKRRRITATMQRVANGIEWYVDTGGNAFARHSERVWKTERSRTDINIDIQRLERMDIMPCPTNERTRHYDIANHLYRTISILERCGVRKAREFTKSMNVTWKTNDTP